MASQYALARVYQNIGETAEAIALLEKVVEIEAETLRVDHSNRVGSIYCLAQCHHDAGNYERALQLARSIEGVAQNRGRRKRADGNARLICCILEDMKRRDEMKMRMEEMRLRELRLEEVD